VTQASSGAAVVIDTMAVSALINPDRWSAAVTRCTQTSATIHCPRGLSMRPFVLSSTPRQGRPACHPVLLSSVPYRCGRQRGIPALADVELTRSCEIDVRCSPSTPTCRSALPAGRSRASFGARVLCSDGGRRSRPPSCQEIPARSSWELIPSEVRGRTVSISAAVVARVHSIPTPTGLTEMAG
jgi:hypothetical protein